MDSLGNFQEFRTQNWIMITDEEFRLISSLVYDRIGIHLTDQKRTLLMGRLQKVLRAHKFTNFREYYNFVVADKSGQALSDLANFISTNHTFFFRENDHFEFFLKRALPELKANLDKTGSRDIRIWCAGCSSGEEPYTLVMLMMEFFGPNYANYDAGLLATDISENALRTARAGIYSHDRIKNLPAPYIKKYFTKMPDGDYRVAERIIDEVTYRRFNLMNETFPFKKPFDIIFCRNVMIYFDDPTRDTLVDKFYDLTVPKGYLFIGHSETLNRDKTRYRYIQPALYQKLD